MRNKLIYAADAVITFTCLLGFYHVYEKAGLPVVFDHNSLVIERTDQLNSSFEIGDKLISLNGINLLRQEEVEFILDSKAVGESVDFSAERNGSLISSNIKLIRYYTLRYILIQFAVSVVFIFLAVFVFTKRKENAAARMFNWVLLFSALIIATTWGRISIEPRGLGHFIRLVFNAAYAFTAVFFVHFTFVFPYNKSKNSGLVTSVLYSLAGALTVVMAYGFLKATSAMNLQWFNFYNSVFNLNRIYFVLCVVLGLINVVHTYVTAREESERRKLRWILLGLMIGPLCLVSLWIIPQIFTSRGLVDEEFILLAMLSVPIAFTISIVKYHILNIDQLFKRGTVYTFVFFLVLLIYVTVVGSITFFIGTLTVTSSLLASTIAAVIIAALFQPIKERTQLFVDKKFFHVSYNYRQAEREFIEHVKYCYDENSLCKMTVDTIQSLIPNEKTDLSIIGGEALNLAPEQAGLFNYTKTPIALSEHIELGAKHERAASNFFIDKKIVMAFRVYSESSGLLGALFLGEKKSRFRYNLEDVDLLEVFCHQTALAIDRIKLQRKLINEQIEKTRLRELNELKSYFVSSVTHELKTPLTSIKMFTELIKESPRLKKEKRDKYLEIIKGESSRLSRLIDNVLDITKIEKGIKEYRKTIVNVNECIHSVMKTMEYQLKLNGFVCETKLALKKPIITADKDAIEEVLINLIANSIKYSAQEKKIIVSATVEDDTIILTVADQGIGIADNDLKKIFEPFERANSQIAKNTTGTGLGLALVKHIADAHNAKLEVKSELGKGSSFTITFPLTELRTYNEKNISN